MQRNSLFAIFPSYHSRLLTASRGGALLIFILIVTVIALIILYVFFGRVQSPAQKQYYPGEEGSGHDYSYLVPELSKVPTSSQTGIEITDIGRSSSSNSKTQGYVIGSDTGGQTSFSAAPEVRVQYTDSGFEPAQLTLTLPQHTVTFVNNSKKLMWPLAAPFDNPTFNSRYGIAPGDSFTATLPSAARTYLYYNRLNESQQGRIIVE